MKKNHPTIIILYIPGGCTGVWQPLDVGIQRLMKLSIKHAAHRDVIEEALSQIKAGKPAHEIKLDTTLGALRDRSVGWIVQAIRNVSDPVTITRAFEMCHVGNWNLSYASLTSPEALAGLRNLRTTNPTLHAALTQTVVTEVTELPVLNSMEEDTYNNQTADDDCDVLLDVVASFLATLPWRPILQLVTTEGLPDREMRRGQTLTRSLSLWLSDMASARESLPVVMKPPLGRGIDFF
ncbi:hypothetical protein K438DRAFT_1604100 [Mycena galopus ATCC 62051]|nr:hypothetical protein K438DRAFT_1604100 [Mycena galopus ATCC 62051]